MADKCNTQESMDMSKDMQRLFKEKQKMRSAATEYYMKAVQNPYRPLNAGPVFDPALQRFSAMSAYHAEIVHHGPRNFAATVLMIFGPITAMYYLLKSEKEKKEAMYRNGLVRYEDRIFKTLL